MMMSELEAVALRLFDEHGFSNVSIEDIALEARISVRTFYRYFASKEDVLQFRIYRRREVVRAELSDRPADEPPLRSLRLALGAEVSAVDPVVLRRWCAVNSDNPNVLKGVYGAIHIELEPVIAEFLGTRLDVPSDSLVPTMFAAAALGVFHAAISEWFQNGGDLATKVSVSFEVLENGMSGDSKSWTLSGDRVEPEKPRSRIRTKAPKTKPA